MSPNIPKKLVCREYLQQQIYIDQDIIIDRMNTVKFHAPGAGKIIDEMLNIFCKFAEKYQFANDLAPYLAFIEDLAEQLGFESQDAIDHFNKRYQDMQKGEIFDNSIYFMTVLYQFHSTRLSIRFCLFQNYSEQNYNLFLRTL